MTALVPHAADVIDQAVPWRAQTVGGPLFQHAMAMLADLRRVAAEHGRISDDEQGILAAMAFSLRADCTRRKVACIVADVHGRVIGAGRNGAPPGRAGCLSAGACPRGQRSKTEVAPGSAYSGGGATCIALHAEDNGIIYTDPIARRGGTIWITDAPCDQCCIRLAGSALARAVWPQHHEDGTWSIVSYDLAGPVGGHYGAPPLMGARGQTAGLPRP